jgi:hypothetical protein
MNTISIDEKSLARFIIQVEGLHDALLHEATLSHPGYVTGSGSMFGDSDLPRATMIFQSQFAGVAAVRLHLYEVSVFKIDFSFEFDLEGEIQGNEIVLYLLGKKMSAYSEIRAKRAEYVMLGQPFLGSDFRLKCE